MDIDSCTSSGSCAGTRISFCSFTNDDTRWGTGVSRTRLPTGWSNYSSMTEHHVDGTESYSRAVGEENTSTPSRYLWQRRRLREPSRTTPATLALSKTAIQTSTQSVSRGPVLTGSSEYPRVTASMCIKWLTKSIRDVFPDQTVAFPLRRGSDRTTPPD